MKSKFKRKILIAFLLPILFNFLMLMVFMMMFSVADEDTAGSENSNITIEDNNLDFIVPLPKGSYVLSSPYGMRLHPITHQKHGHSGLDLAAPSGTAILSVSDGEVIFSGILGGYGNLVIIDHKNGYFTAYGHCLFLKVKNRQMVKKGQIIAGVGSTGMSTGNHLHFEVRKGANSHLNAVDPYPYIFK